MALATYCLLSFGSGSGNEKGKLRRPRSNDREERETKREPEKQMHHELVVEFGVGLENRGWVAGEPAFRCGLPFRGGGRLIRDAGSVPRVPARGVADDLIKVAWSREVSWQKKIRCSKR